MATSTSCSPWPAASARSPRPSPPRQTRRRESGSRRLVRTGASDQVAAAFAAEANGLRWLAEVKAVPVPRVLAVTEGALVVSMIQPGRATPEAAFQFGADLAQLHGAGADGFGAPWPGFIASLPLDNTLTRADMQPWPQWYAAAGWCPTWAGRRLGRAAARRREAGRGGDRPDRLAGRPGRAAEPHPRRLLGRERAVVRRPGLAHRPGGTRRPPRDGPGHAGPVRRAHLDRILVGYQDTWPLAAGWRARVPLHQLHPLLVHACLFGASYREEVRAAARAALAG